MQKEVVVLAAVPPVVVHQVSSKARRRTGLDGRLTSGARQAAAQMSIWGRAVVDSTAVAVSGSPLFAGIYR